MIMIMEKRLATPIGPNFAEKVTERPNFAEQSRSQPAQVTKKLGTKFLPVRQHSTLAINIARWSQENF